MVCDAQMSQKSLLVTKRRPIRALKGIQGRDVTYRRPLQLVGATWSTRKELSVGGGINTNYGIDQRLRRYNNGNTNGITNGVYLLMVYKRDVYTYASNISSLQR